MKIGAIAAEIKMSGTDIQLLPAGQFRADDGRPEECAYWELTEAGAPGVIERSRSENKIMIDYGHQALYSRDNGKPAPAAGWYAGLKFIPGTGMFGTGVEWTADAKKAIKAKEFRYVSAVFHYDPATGEVLKILFCGITNTPAIDGMQELAAAAANHINNQNKPMNKELKAWLEKHGIDAEKPDTKKIAELSAKIEKKDIDFSELAKAGGLENETDFQKIQTACIDKLTAAAEAEIKKPGKDAGTDTDKAGPEKIETALAKQVADLAKQVEANKRDTMIAAAEKEGKLYGALVTWARQTDPAILEEFLKNAPAVAALTRQQTEAAEIEKKTGITPEEIAVCEKMGLTPEEFISTKKGE